MATSEIKLPEGFELEQNTVGLPEGFELEPEPTFVESVKAGIGGAAESVVKSATGVARAAIDMTPSTVGTATSGASAGMGIPYEQFVPPPKKEVVDEIIKKGGEDWTAHINAYWKTHPDEYYAVKSSGALPVALELIANPGKLVGGVIQSIPLMLEGYLGTAVAGGAVAGGVVGMAIPMIGEEYTDARAEGTPVMPALIRAISSGVGQAALEEWSLSKKLGIAKMIPKSSMGKVVWEGLKAYPRGYAQEGSQQFWSNVNKWLFTDRRQDWFESVAKSAQMGGPLELAMSAGFAGMGAVGKQHKPAEQIRRLDVINQVVKEHPDFKPEQVQEISDEIKVQKDTIVQEYIDQVQERFPAKITDQKSLEEVGNAIALDFGVKTDKPIIWVWSKNVRRGFNGLHQYNGTNNEHIITIFKGHRTDDIFSDNLLKRGVVYQIKNTVVHELGHIVKPPILKPGAKRRFVHHPAFYKWVEKHQNLLTKIVKVPKPQLADAVAKEVNPDGKPTVKEAEKWLTDKPYQAELYHGAGGERTQIGATPLGIGTYYSNSQDIAKGYGVAKKSTVSIKKPFYSTEEELTKMGDAARDQWETDNAGRKIDIETKNTLKDQAAAEAVTQQLKSQGYDGVVVKRPNNVDEVIKFEVKTTGEAMATLDIPKGFEKGLGNKWTKKVANRTVARQLANELRKDNWDVSISGLGKQGIWVNIKPSAKPTGEAMAVESYTNGFITKDGKYESLPPGTTHKVATGDNLSKELKNKIRVSIFQDHIVFETAANHFTQEQMNRIGRVLRSENFGNVMLSIGGKLTEVNNFTGVKLHNIREMLGENQEFLKAEQLSRRKLLVFIHKIPLQILGWTDTQYRDKLKELTGKSSAKDLSVEDLRMVYDHFKSLYNGDVTLTPEDYQKPIPFMGGTTTMSAIIADVAKVVDEVPSETKIPEKIRQRVFGRAVSAALEKGRAVLIGIDNSRPSRLAKLLGGGKDSVLTNIFRNNLIEKGSNTKDAFQASFHQNFQKFLKDNNISPAKLAKYSRSMHRWWMPVEMVKEFMGKGPDLLMVKLNGKQFELTRDNLLSLYMQFRQEAGKGYATKEGFKINEFYTGPLKDIEGDFNTIEKLIKADPIAMKLMEYWYNVADKSYFKPNINNTSQILIGKDIAVVSNLYYPLSPEKVERAGKKTGFTFKEPAKRFNLLEEQSFLNPRKGPRGPLEVGSFFQDMADMAEGVAEYSAYAPALRIARTVLAHAPTVKAWREKGYNKIYDNLLKIIKNETELSSPKGWLEQMILRITRGTTRAIFSLPNIRTPAIQISSTAMFAKDFDAKYIATGLKNAISSKMEKFMQDVPWAWCRYYMDKGPRMIGGVAETAGLSLPMQGKLSAGQTNGILLKIADLKPFHILYETIRAEYLDAQNGKLEPGSMAEKYWHGKDVKYGIDTENALNLIRDRFTIGRRGQQSYDKFDRSVATSSHGTLNKIFYLFRSFQEGAMNAQQEVYDDYVNSEKTAQDKSTFARKTGAITSSYIIEALIRDSVTWAEVGIISATARALGAGGEPPEENKWYEWGLHALLGPLDMIPLVGSYFQGVIGRFARVISHQKPLYMGRIAEPLPLQVINTLAEVPDNFAQSIAFFINGEPEKGKKSLVKAITSAYEGIAAPAGVPVYQIKKIRKLIEGEPEAQSSGRRRRRG